MSRQSSMLLSLFLFGLLSHNFAIHVVASEASLEDNKAYYGGHHCHKTPHCGQSSSTGSSPKDPSSSRPAPYVNPPSPATSVSPLTPVTPITPVTPTTPTTPVSPAFPVTPITPVSPAFPVTPITPVTPMNPGSPFPVDPYSPFSGFYWSNHPSMIWGLFGWWCPLASAFDVSSLPGISASMTLPQALSNSLADGYGVLYREGTASLLNSMVNRRFVYSTSQVKRNFVSALGSEKTAASQGKLFQMANEGKIKRNV